MCVTCSEVHSNAGCCVMNAKNTQVDNVDNAVICEKLAPVRGCWWSVDNEKKKHGRGRCSICSMSKRPGGAFYWGWVFDERKKA